jgi:hypothetical protein
MGDYKKEDARYTMILVKCGETKEAIPGSLYRRHEFDLVRFNVDVNPNAKPDVVVCGDTDHGKIFERIWKVDEAPFAVKQNFGGAV